MRFEHPRSKIPAPENIQFLRETRGPGLPASLCTAYHHQKFNVVRFRHMQGVGDKSILWGMIGSSPSLNSYNTLLHTSSRFVYRCGSRLSRKQANKSEMHMCMGAARVGPPHSRATPAAQSSASRIAPAPAYIDLHMGCCLTYKENNNCLESAGTSAE